MEEDFTRYLTAASRRISEAHKPPIDARETICEIGMSLA